MTFLLLILLGFILLGVVLVLGVGIWTMARGETPHRSQKLMRWRIGLQLLAVIALLALSLYIQLKALG